MSQAYPYPIALTPVMVLPLQWCSPKALRTIAHSQWSYWGPGMSRYCWSHQILLGTSVIFSVKCPHMRNIVIPRLYLITPIVGPTVDIRQCWVLSIRRGLAQSTDTLFVSQILKLAIVTPELDIWKSFPPRLRTSAPALFSRQTLTCTSPDSPMRGLIGSIGQSDIYNQSFYTPLCVQRIGNDLTDYYHQFLAKSRLVFTGPVPTEQSAQFPPQKTNPTLTP